MSKRANPLGVGLILGAAVGVTIGVATDNLGVWIGVGAGVGLLLDVVFTFRGPKRTSSGPTDATTP